MNYKCLFIFSLQLFLFLRLHELFCYDFRLNRNKTEYMEYKFKKRQTNDNLKVKIGEHIILKVLSFRYLKSIIQSNGKIDRDVIHRI